MDLVQHAALVVLAQFALFIALPLWAFSRLKWRHPADALLAALLAGVCSIAISGRIANEVRIGVPWMLALWAAAWLVTGLCLRRIGRGRLTFSRRERPLFALLLLAGAVRWIHPFETWALGQSDAYSHLEFAREVMETGSLHHADYPPAYAWVMASTAYLTGGHPYWVARFGGAFFGIGLVLALYALTARLTRQPAAYFAAACAAGCPVFFLLQKTGVGCFANQLGLMLIPAAVWAYTGRSWGALFGILVTLAVSVPMMLIHVVLLLSLLVIVDRHRDARAGWVLLAGLLTCALALALIMQKPIERGVLIAGHLTGQYSWADSKSVNWTHVLLLLLRDFVSVKRMGLPSDALNLLAWSWLALLTAWCVRAWRLRRADWACVSAWLLLTSVHVLFGVGQFSNYQREGWSLLIAACIAAGVVAQVIEPYLTARFGRRVIQAICVLIALPGLILWPRHTIAAGASESEVVQTLMRIDPSVTVVARRMSGFATGMGDLVRVLHPRVVSGPTATRLANVKAPAMFLRDYPSATPSVSPVMRFLQPALSSEYEHFWRSALIENLRLERLVSEAGWTRESRSTTLDVWVLAAEDRIR